MDLDNAIGAIWRSQELTSDLHTLCRFGGRFAGSEGEAAARAFLAERLEELSHGTLERRTFPFEVWSRDHASLALLGDDGAADLPVTSLVLSPDADDLELEVVDLGRGAEEDFRARWQELRGRAVLVRHEFPFSVSHVHRRKKYGWAVEAGAAAFLIANHQPGIGVVSGSSGAGQARDLPALGTSYEAGRRIAEACRLGVARVRLTVRAQRRAQEMETLAYDIHGRTEERVILCAHVDGHDLAESAMDNASGVAAALEVARRLAPEVAGFRRGLRICFFTVEEWALIGSRLYLESLSEEERQRIALAVNLDTVVGSSQLNALVSNDTTLADFVRGVTTTAGAPVEPIFPLQANSDHYNFFLQGIPALRLIAGYEQPDARTRFLLTPADTSDKVDRGQLRLASMTTLQLVHAACTRDAEISPRFDPRTRLTGMDQRDPWLADRT